MPAPVTIFNVNGIKLRLFALDVNFVKVNMAPDPKIILVLLIAGIVVNNMAAGKMPDGFGSYETACTAPCTTGG